MEEETQNRIKAIFKRMDDLSSKLHEADFHQALNLHKWKVQLSYDWALLSDELSLLVVERDSIISQLIDEGATVAMATRKASCTPAGRLMVAVKNKMKGTEKFLTHLRDKVRAMEEEKFNQY